MVSTQQTPIQRLERFYDWYHNRIKNTHVLQGDVEERVVEKIINPFKD